MDRSYGAVVIRRKKEIEFLLVHHANHRGVGHWGLPKGHPEPGETTAETAVREVLEETNAIIEITPGFSATSSYVLPRGEPKEVTFFLGDFKREGKQSVDPDEIQEILWCGYQEAIERVTYDDTRQILVKAGEHFGLADAGH